MSEITLKAIEQLFDTKFDEKLQPIRTDIAGIKTTMGSLATSEELEEIKTDLASVKATMKGHTTLLDGIAGDIKTLLDEKTVAARRLDRLEHWAQQVGERLGIKLEF